MFTLTFNSDSAKTTVCGLRYDVVHHDRGDSATITVFSQSITSQKGSGVKFHIGGLRQDSYRVCFVSNEAGKTIDKIGPFVYCMGGSSANSDRTGIYNQSALSCAHQEWVPIATKERGNE